MEGCAKLSETALRLHPCDTVTEEAGLEVIRRRLEGVVGGEFIDSLLSIDELRDRRRRLKIGYPLSLHDVLD